MTIQYKSLEPILRGYDTGIDGNHDTGISPQWGLPTEIGQVAVGGEEDEVVIPEGA